MLNMFKKDRNISLFKRFQFPTFQTFLFYLMCKCALRQEKFEIERGIVVRDQEF